MGKSKAELEYEKQRQAVIDQRRRVGAAVGVDTSKPKPARKPYSGSRSFKRSSPQRRATKNWRRKGRQRRLPVSRDR